MIELEYGDLEHVCPKCAGKGTVFFDDTCENCDGIGYLLTHTGSQLMEFVKRHLRIKSS